MDHHLRPGLTPRATLAALTTTVVGGPPLLAGMRLVTIDGPAGSGKSTLAADLTGALRDRGLVVAGIEMDDLFHGWSGLDAGIDQLVTGVIEPLARGGSGRYRRWDWAADGWAETVVVPRAEVLVVEGCGAAPRAAGAWTTLLAFVETDRSTRLARGLARDGEGARAEWVRWMTLEARVLRREDTRGRADVHLDGAGRILRWRPGAPGPAGRTGP